MNLKLKSVLLRNITFILFPLCLFFSNARAQFALNVWDVMRKEFSLNHSITQPEVQHQLRWLISHPSYLHKLTQSEPYIYHIVTQIKKRHLPGELALIPMIESSYDPFAYSGAGAAGLWQLMPGTGTDLGLKRDWWYDGRRSIGPSTDAALNYLSYLNTYFNGDWLLSIAAYDSGEGTISKSIKMSGQASHANFWILPVPAETRAYVPRLLALAEIIQHPQRYGVDLPDIPHAPYFEEVNIGSQIDLNHAAKLAGISYKELIKLNPGFNRWATPPYSPFKLLIPADKVENFSRNLASLPEEKRVGLTKHLVSMSDNLPIIAQKYHTTVSMIKELNQLKTNSVKKGQYVLIPSTNVPVVNPHPQTAQNQEQPVYLPTTQHKILHIVQKNDSIKNIVNQYKVTESELRQWNKLATNQALRPGQQLIILKSNKATSAYVVKRGDTLSKIAKLNTTKVSNLMRLNPSLRGKYLKPGQTLLIG